MNEQSEKPGRSRAALVVLVFVSAFWMTGCASPAAQCIQPDSAQNVYPSNPVVNGVVSFEATQDKDFPLAMYLRDPGKECERMLVDRFEYSGGAPKLEGVVTLPFEGQESLFVIVSWPVEHRGIGTYGTYYQIRAYQKGADGLLEQNNELAKYIDVSGVEGTDDGEPSTFMGKDAAELEQVLAKPTL